MEAYHTIYWPSPWGHEKGGGGGPARRRASPEEGGNRDWCDCQLPCGGSGAGAWVPVHFFSPHIGMKLSALKRDSFLE